MAPIDLKGIFPPIATPFIDGKLALEQLAANIARWAGSGIRGIVVMGSNGEAAALSEAEKRDLVQAAVESSPETLLVIAGTGCESTAETVRLTNDCAQRGARAALVIPPHFFASRMNDAALYAHYRQVADAATIPIILYNVPKFVHLTLSPDLVSRLSAYPNIVGIKDSSGDVSLMGEYIRRAAADFSVLVGTAGALFGGLALGCPGGILALANVAPKACVEILTRTRSGDYAAARSLQLKMLPVDKAVTAVYGVAGLKAALDLTGYFGGAVRPPLLPLEAHEKKALERILREAGVIHEDKG
jgi:4-hydroxy-2-oxoglutarate aldolase